MFPRRYFAARYFAPRYWPQSLGQSGPVIVDDTPRRRHSWTAIS